MTYTVAERAAKIYNTVVDIFDYNATSDVVTPLDLVKRQFATVEARGTVCIPGAGIGTYVLAAIEAGFDPANIYAVEFNKAYFCLGSGIYTRLGVNYIYADYLNWDPKMKFDVIIGNPPYQNPNKGKKAANGRSANGSPLWSKFIKKSASLLKQDGILSLLIPSAVTTPKSRGMSAAKGLSLLSVDFGMEEFFKVGTQISHVCWKNGESTALVKVNGLDYPTSLPIANVASRSELLTLERIWSGKANWQYMDNRGHIDRPNKENILVIRRMYSGGTFKYNMGLDMTRFDKESVVGLECQSPEEVTKWLAFLDSPNATFLRRVTNYAGNISAAYLQPVNPEVLN